MASWLVAGWGRQVRPMRPKPMLPMVLPWIVWGILEGVVLEIVLLSMVEVMRVRVSVEVELS